MQLQNSLFIHWLNTIIESNLPEMATDVEVEVK